MRQELTEGSVPVCSRSSIVDLRKRSPVFTLCLAILAQWTSAQPSSDHWSLLPKRPFGATVSLQAQGGYLLTRPDAEADTTSFQIRSVQDLELVAEGDFSGCRFAGRYTICGRVMSENGIRQKMEEFWYLDAGERGRKRSIAGLAEAIDSGKRENRLASEPMAVFAKGDEPGPTSEAYPPLQAVMSEAGVAVLALPFPGKILVFRTRKVDQGSGDTSRIWKYAGSLCIQTAPGLDSACGLSHASRFQLDRILHGAVYAVETREGSCPRGWRSRDYGATWERSIVIDQADNGQKDSTLVVVEQTCDSAGVLGRAVALTRDRGADWNRLPDAVDGQYVFRNGELLNHRLLANSYSIRSSRDFGRNWLVENLGVWEEDISTAVFANDDAIVVVRNDGSAFKTTRSRLPYGEDVGLSFRQRSVRKVRLRGSEIFVLQGENVVQSKLLRLRKGQWTIVRRNIQDFEVVGTKVLVLLGREGSIRNPIPEDSLVYAFQRRVVGSENLFDWDSVFTRHDSLYRVSERPFIDRITVSKDGGLQLKFHSYNNNAGGEKLVFVYQSKDQGAHWKISQESKDTLPEIDSANFRLDSLDQLWARNLPEDVGIAAKTLPALARVHGHLLKFRLSEPTAVQVDLVAPSGRREEILGLQTLAQGEHAIALPRRAGIWYARVRYRQQTETVALPPI
ncbi:MAG: hypothetical protein IPK50_19610 [Fibrobacterota bacterium]|nr:hypothetical protein [Fibrobacterota bacterium]QQS04472.1 MAG: hypothetical protein IPK50_19610 [Fibrobacterota bacterium]